MASTQCFEKVLETCEFYAKKVIGYEKKHNPHDFQKDPVIPVVIVLNYRKAYALYKRVR